MSTLTFVLGMAVLGIFIVAAAFILSGSVTAAARSLKDADPQTLQQPTMAFLTEFDAADYLGVSLNELDYMRSEELLDGSFIAITSLEQSGEEEYTEIVDGVEVVKYRPIMVNVTRFLYNRELLDKKMTEIIRSGRHINPNKRRTSKNSNSQNGQKQYNGNKKNNNGNGSESFKSESKSHGEDKNNGGKSGKQNNYQKQNNGKQSHQNGDKQRKQEKNNQDNDHSDNDTVIDLMDAKNQ